MDVWVGTRSLKERFPRVYAMEGNKQCMVSDRWVDDQWHWNWHRNMPERGRTGEQFIDMQQELHHLELSDREDTWQCSMRHDGSFTVACIRKHIDEKILHSENLMVRGIDVPSILCPSCGDAMEDNDHVFVKCDIVVQIWKRIFRWIDMDQPTFGVIADVFNWIDVVNVRQKARGVLEAIFISAIGALVEEKMSLLIGRCGYKGTTKGVFTSTFQITRKCVSTTSTTTTLKESTIIALGTVYKTDVKQMLHNKELPKDCYKVSVDKSLVDAACKPDVGNNGFKTVRNAVGSFFAWPKNQVVLDPKATPPSTLQMIGENKTAPKL
ncbi:RNA-directed DNA polymerase, eukaryota, reverse transcriptase zinc-binding domain protein [Tanacetum coccineum]